MCAIDTVPSHTHGIDVFFLPHAADRQRKHRDNYCGWCFMNRSCGYWAVMTPSTPCVICGDLLQGTGSHSGTTGHTKHYTVFLSNVTAAAPPPRNTYHDRGLCILNCRRLWSLTPAGVTLAAELHVQHNILASMECPTSAAFFV